MTVSQDSQYTWFPCYFQINTTLIAFFTVIKIYSFQRMQNKESQVFFLYDDLSIYYNYTFTVCKAMADIFFSKTHFLWAPPLKKNQQPQTQAESKHHLSLKFRIEEKIPCKY